MASSATAGSAGQASNNGSVTTSKRKEIYKYELPWQVYSMNWSSRPDKRFRLALGSITDEYKNWVRIISLDEEQGEFIEHKTFEHPYPTTKISWIPKGNFPDLLATSGDYLRIWRVMENNEVDHECCLHHPKYQNAYCSPLTSFDWNEVDPNLIVTASIDTTCSVWGLETQQAIGQTRSTISGYEKTQLIAHDREVFDVAWSSGMEGQHAFATVGADGSLRLFDLRELKQSIILYEGNPNQSLLRLAWNKQDSHYIATFAIDSTEVIILDIRNVTNPIARLRNHRQYVNGLAWAPHSSCHICTAADDCQALIWGIENIPRSIDDPILAYTAAAEINQIQWSSAQPDWIAINYKNCLELLRV